ncbi:PepSY domain-containing protein [Roseibium aestuarii]|uniref:PepSY domain-containing protein n=1 Tax=Roseibium aestuarii TaxID=2600299 RepID=A0ABW4JUA0_9HYPH|nr:PepSY domain-containing protein [Roseibium aestuarii]
MNRFSLAFLMLALAGLASPAAAQCLSQDQARQAVASGQAAPLGSLKGQIGGEIVKAELCIEGGQYVYRVSVVSGGAVRTVVINASR